MRKFGLLFICFWLLVSGCSISGNLGVEDFIDNNEGSNSISGDVDIPNVNEDNDSEIVVVPDNSQGESDFNPDFLSV